jgi:hypothetical protein
MAWPVARLVEPARSGHGQHLAAREIGFAPTIRQPGDVPWKRWVQGACCDEHTRVNDTWRGARNAHDKPNCHDAEADEDKRVSLANTITPPCYRDRKHRCGDVDRHCEKLGCG